VDVPGVSSFWNEGQEASPKPQESYRCVCGVTPTASPGASPTASPGATRGAVPGAVPGATPGAAPAATLSLPLLLPLTLPLSLRAGAATEGAVGLGEYRGRGGPELVEEGPGPSS